MTHQVASESGSWIVESWLPTPSAGPSSHAERANVAPAGDGGELQAEVIVRTMTQMLRCNDSEAACRLLANRLQQFLGCRQVAIGICGRHRQRCRIRGLSGVVRFDSHSRFITGIQNALDETLARQTELQWPSPDTASPEDVPHAHETLIGILGAECVASLPLLDGDDQLVGAVLLVDEPAESAFQLVHRYGAALGSCLAVLERQHAGLLTRQWWRMQDRIGSSRLRTVALTAAVLALLLALPWPYVVTCQSQLQPVTRRFVVAPYDGTLASAQVAPGDVVQAGTVLARMDEQEIRWELAGLEADYARARKERDAAMAAHHTSTAQLAELEMDRLEVQIKLQKHRIENLAIRSPIDGVVVAGDLEKAEGAPLTIGQSLFEVAPLEKMCVEVRVPEEDIAAIQAGMLVTVSLDAFPDDPVDGKIRRIHPQAELKEKESVFVAEFEVENSQHRLRPGMNGWADITGKKRSLGWILFHKPWTSLRRACGW